MLHFIPKIMVRVSKIRRSRVTRATITGLFAIAIIWSGVSGVSLTARFLEPQTAHASCDPRNPNPQPPVINSMTAPTGNYADPGVVPVRITGEGGYECVGPPQGGLGWEHVDVTVVYTIKDASENTVYQGSWSANPCNVPICIRRQINVNHSIDASSWPEGTYTIEAFASGAGGEGNSVSGSFTITRGNPPSWSFSCGTLQQVVTAGNPATFGVTVVSHDGFTGSVNVGVSGGLPSGATANGDVVNVPANGSMSALVTVNTNANMSASTSTLTFRATASGHPPRECQGVLIVNTPPPAGQPPIVSLDAVPQTVEAGDTTSLSWSISQSHADSCTRTASPANSNWAGSVSGAQARMGSHVGPSIALNSTTTFSISCSNSSGSSSDSVTVNVNPPSPVVPTLIVRPSSQIIEVGQSASYTAIYDADGEGTASSPVEVTIPASWASNNTTIAEVTGFGTFTGMRVGTTTITAIYQGLANTAQLAVTPGQVIPIPTLAISPVQQSVDVGSVAIYAATYDADGSGTAFSPIDVSATASWSSLDPDTGRSDGGGNFTGMRAGSVPINASYLGLVDSAMLTVIGSGLACSPTRQNVSVDETATLTASGGSSPYTWSAPGGTPSSGSGNTFSVRYASVGNRLVVVSGGGQTSSPCTVRVNTDAEPTPVLTVNPNMQSVGVGEIATYSAIYDPDGSGPQSAQNVTTVATWQSRSPSVAVSQGGGRFRGVAQGSTSVRATHRGISATAGMGVTGSQLSCTFGANPSTLFIPPPRSTTLSWQCSRPAACTVTNITDGGQVASSNTGAGSGLSSPRYTTQYRLNCEDGAVTLDTTVRVFDVTTRIEIMPQ